MNRLAVCLLLLVASACAANAANIPFPTPGVDTLVVPDDSSLRFEGWDKDKTAKFRGKFKLSGTYYYSDGAFNDGPQFTGEAYFIPDRPASLPHFLERNYTWPIYVTNAEKFIAAVAAAPELDKVRRKGGGFLAGHAVIWADSFTAGIECDAPNYGVNFVALAAPANARVSKKDSNPGC